MKRAPVFLSLFFLASITELILDISDVGTFRWVSKPLIIISLIGYYWSKTDQPSRIFLMALTACLAGDVFLLAQDFNASFFIVGLISFLIAHLFLIYTYRLHRTPVVKDELKNIQRTRMAFPIIMSGTALVVYLYPGLNEMKIPVITYASVLTLMVLTALFRFGRTNATSFWSVFSGAILFMISDAILAVDKFASPVAYAGVLIMVTYIAAQYLIVKGILAHVGH